MIDIASAGRFSPTTRSTLSAITTAAPERSRKTPMIVPKTITRPMLVISPPNPSAITCTTCAEFIRAARPTPKAVRISARNGWSLSFAVLKTMKAIATIRMTISNGPVTIGGPPASAVAPQTGGKEHGSTVLSRRCSGAVVQARPER